MRICSASNISANVTSLLQFHDILGAHILGTSAADSYGNDISDCEWLMHVISNLLPVMCPVVRLQMRMTPRMSLRKKPCWKTKQGRESVRRVVQQLGQVTGCAGFDVVRITCGCSAFLVFAVMSAHS